MIGAFTRRSFLALPVALAAAPRVRLTNTARDALASVAPDDLGTIEKMNRADRKHLPRLPLLTLPLDNALSPITWCTLPVLLHGFSLDRKAVIVHLPSQQFGAYESGVLNYWGPISSGAAKHPTPPGMFQLNWRSPGRHSTVDPDWFMPWYWNIDEKRGIAMHAYELPGLPESHACIRLLERDARWMYEWGVAGTPVAIFGEYDFASLPPWRTVEFWNRTVAIDLANGKLT